MTSHAAPRVTAEGPARDPGTVWGDGREDAPWAARTMERPPVREGPVRTLADLLDADLGRASLVPDARMSDERDVHGWFIAEGRTCGRVHCRREGAALVICDIELSAAVRGQGIVARWCTRLADAAPALGIDRLRLIAGGVDGGVAWARMGFDWEAPSESAGERVWQMRPDDPRAAACLAVWECYGGRERAWRAYDAAICTRDELEMAESVFAALHSPGVAPPEPAALAAWGRHKGATRWLGIAEYTGGQTRRMESPGQTIAAGIGVGVPGRELYRARQVGARVHIERNVALAGIGDFDDDADGWALVGRTNGAGDNGTAVDICVIDGVPNAIIDYANNKGRRLIAVAPDRLDKVKIGQTRMVRRTADPYTQTNCPGEEPLAVNITNAPDQIIEGDAAGFTFTSAGAPERAVCHIVGEPFDDCDTGASHQVSGLAPGTYTFEVEVRRGTQAVSATHTFTVVPAPVELTVQITSAPVAIDEGFVAGFAFETTGDPTSMECGLVDGTFGPCDTATAHALYYLSAGSYTFEVRAHRGDETAVAQHAFVVRAPLGVVITDGPFTVPADDPARVDFVTYGDPEQVECRLDTAAFGPCTEALAHELSGLEVGNHTVEVRVTRGAEQLTASRTFEVTPALSVEITDGPTSILVGEPASFAFTTGGTPDSVECRFDTEAFGPCDAAGSHARSDLSAGAHVFEVRVMRGTHSLTDSASFTVELPALEVTITSGPSSFLETESGTFTFETAGVPDEVECLVDGAAVPCSGTGAHTVSGLAPGTHTFAVQATRGVETASASASFEVIEVAPLSVTITDAPIEITEGADAVFTFLADGDPNALECRLGAEAFDDCLSESGHVISGLAPGEYTFEVRATRGAEQTSATHTFTVTEAVVNEDLSVLLVQYPANPSTSDVAAFSWITTGDPEATSCRYNGGLWQPCVPSEDGTYNEYSSGLPAGVYTFDVRVTRGAETAIASHSWEIVSMLPVNSAAPTVQGALAEGATLTADAGTWTNAPTAYAYQWQRSFGFGWSNIAGATEETYTLGQDDVDAHLRVRVIASNSYGASLAAFSDATDKVTSGPPAATAAPVVTGSPIVGLRLTASNGAWTNSPSAYERQWQRDFGSGWVDIAGATDATYRLSGADLGADVRVQVRALNGQGASDWAASNAAGPVQEASGNSGVSFVETASQSASLGIDPTAADTSGPITLEAWVKSTSTNNGNFLTRYNASTLTGWLIGQYSGGFQCQMRAGSTSHAIVRSSQPINDGRWHHVACVWEGTGATPRVYIDGRQDQSPTVTKTANFGDVASSGGGIRMASYNTTTGPVADFTGTLDSVHYARTVKYTGDFTPEETFEVGPGTVALAQLDEGTGGSFGIEGLMTANGTLAGGPSWVTPARTLTAEIVSGPPNSGARTAAFTLYADMESSTECKLDDGAYTPCDTRDVFMAENLSLGEHTLTLRANRGNTSVTDAYTWTVTNHSAISYNGSLGSIVSTQDPTATDGTSAVTVEAWMRTSDTSAAGGAILARHIAATNNHTAIWFGVQGGKLYMQVGGSTTAIYRRSISTASVATGEWMHVAAVWTGPNTNPVLYINGEVAPITTQNAGTLNSLSLGTGVPIRIGSNGSSTAATSQFDGDIDAVHYTRSAKYTGAFTPGDLESDTHTVVLAQMDEGAGTSVSYSREYPTTSTGTLTFTGGTPVWTAGRD